MRLIDADALRETIEFHPTSVSVCMTVEQARGETKFKLRCLEDIDNAPTVPAVTLDWLESQVRGDDETLAKAALRVLRAWNGEQEAR